MNTTRISAFDISSKGTVVIASAFASYCEGLIPSSAVLAEDGVYTIVFPILKEITSIADNQLVYNNYLYQRLEKQPVFHTEIPDLSKNYAQLQKHLTMLREGKILSPIGKQFVERSRDTLPFSRQFDKPEELHPCPWVHEAIIAKLPENVTLGPVRLVNIFKEKVPEGTYLYNGLLYIKSSNAPVDFFEVSKTMEKTDIIINNFLYTPIAPQPNLQELLGGETIDLPEFIKRELKHRECFIELFNSQPFLRKRELTGDLRGYMENVPNGDALLERHPLRDNWVIGNEVTNRYFDTKDIEVSLKWKDRGDGRKLAVFAIQHSVRRTLPYGAWTCESGRVVIFNREYQPILQFQNGEKSYADRNEHIDDIAMVQYFWGDHNTPASYLTKHLGEEKLDQQETRESKRALLISLKILRDYTPEEHSSVSREWSLIK